MTDVLSGLIWVQTVYKIYQQTDLIDRIQSGDAQADLFSLWAHVV